MKTTVLLCLALVSGLFLKAQDKTPQSDLAMLSKDLKPSEVISFKDVEQPPLASDCNSDQDLESQKACTNTHIQRHLATNFDTKIAEEIGLKGKVKIMVQFVIDTEGKPINIKAIGGPEAMNRNAEEVIASLEPMTPGTQNGQPINTACEMPLLFQMAE